MEPPSVSFGYCERLDPGFWAEPVNAVTNLAFLVAAVWAWQRAGDDRLAQGLAVILGLIGIGSGLFHTLATRWAALADVLPILGYVLVYIYAAHVRFWQQPRWLALALAPLSLVAASLAVRAVPGIAGLGGTAAYLPVPLLIILHAGLLYRRAPATAQGLGIGAGILCLSLAARWADAPLCPQVPLGTHFLWHLLNAGMLAHMIAVLVAHPLAGRAGGR